MFAGRIVILGCGSVAQCTLPLLLRERIVTPDRVTVVDMADRRHRIAGEIGRGVTYIEARITPDDLDATLAAVLGPGDILLDLAWNIDTLTLLSWCRAHGVRYLNTSIEVWDPYDDAAVVPPLDRTLYRRHMDLRRVIASWGDNRGPSAVVEHGANPGLVSHWVKQALADIGARVLADGRAGDHAGAIEVALADESFNDLAHVLGVKVIHISERDTQVTDEPRRPGEIVNTWSIDGLYEEGVAPAEIGWGTHERRLPPGASQHAGDGPGNQIALARPGCETWVRSRVPSGPIRGMVIRHGEAFTITDHLTVWRAGRPVYRPTVHYAYRPTDSAVASLLDLAAADYVLPAEGRILNDEITSGHDELGVLVMGHAYRSWWTGSILTIDEARALVPHQSATTLQVAASVMAAVRWMLREPAQGVCVPDELPWRQVLADAAPYLGTQWSDPIDWDPLIGRFDLFERFDDRRVDIDDPWQFTNFLV